MTEQGNEHSEDDLAILQTLDRVLAARGDLHRVTGADDAGPVREYVEVLGLLPYALPAAAPAAGVKTRIMTRLTGSDAAARSALDDVPAPIVRQLAHTSPAVYAPSAGTGWGSYALAAVLAVVFLGAGFLAGQARERSVQIDRLNAALTATYQEQDQDVAAQLAEFADTKRRLNMITEVAQQAYPMRTVRANDAQQTPEGTVWVCGQHQQWYLNLRGLEPPAKDESYYLWFLTDDGAVNGGPIEVRADAPVELEALHMPEGTHGFGVTLENGAQPPAAPGELIILGDKPISL